MYRTNAFLGADGLSCLVLHHSAFLASFRNVLQSVLFHRTVVQAVREVGLCPIVPNRLLIFEELPDRKEADAGVRMTGDRVCDIPKRLEMRFLIHFVWEDL